MVGNRHFRHSPRDWASLCYLGSWMAIKVQELLRQLGADGWVQVRQTGSHRQFHHPTKPGTVTVAGKVGLDIPTGTLNSILKQAGLKK